MIDTWDEFIETQLIELAKKKLIEEGWTPPAEKEPKFKHDDAVEVSADGKQWTLGRFRENTGSSVSGYYIQGSPILWGHCRHAPSWLKPESGNPPAAMPRVRLYNYYQASNGKYFLQHNGKWYWLPLKD